MSKKISKDKTKEALITSLLAKTISLKVTQVVIFSTNTCKQDMISFGNDDKNNNNKDRWNYCHHMTVLSLLGANYRLPLFHMAKLFIWLTETKQRINDFTIGYMINPTLNVNKDFREKVEKCMYTTFGETAIVFN